MARPFGTTKHNLTKKKFGRLLVIERLRGKGATFWKCECTCGNISKVSTDALLRGVVQSCGCFHHEELAKRLTKHGHSKSTWTSRTYKCWANMIQRCTNKNIPNYKNYGARGITVCERWKKFENFLLDMGEKPAGLTIERINNSLGYYKENCKWATWDEQIKNKRHQVRSNRKLPTGVCKNGNKFTAAITHQKQHYYLGIFSTIDAAADAYSRKLAELMFGVK